MPTTCSRPAADPISFRRAVRSGVRDTASWRRPASRPLHACIDIDHGLDFEWFTTAAVRRSKVATLLGAPLARREAASECCRSLDGFDCTRGSARPRVRASRRRDRPRSSGHCVVPLSVTRSPSDVPCGEAHVAARARSTADAISGARSPVNVRVDDPRTRARSCAIRFANLVVLGAVEPATASIALRARSSGSGSRYRPMK